MGRFNGAWHHFTLKGGFFDWFPELTTTYM